MDLELRALGVLPPGLLEDLASFLEGETGIPCRPGPPGPDPRWALVPERGQVNARELLASLGEDRPPGRLILGIAEEDLCSPLFTFVFGEAKLGGTAGVVSLHRLRPEHYGLASDPDRLRSRIRRVALHETGHLLGLVHCRNPACVMRFSGSAEEVDLRGGTFCPPCRKGLTAEVRPSDGERDGPDRRALPLEGGREDRRASP